MSEDGVRTHIVLPARLLKDVDELVGRRKRSAFFAQLAEHEVERLKLLKLARAAAGSFGPDDVPECSTPEKAYAWAREQRMEGQEESDRAQWGKDWGLGDRRYDADAEGEVEEDDPDDAAGQPKP